MEFSEAWLNPRRFSLSLQRKISWYCTVCLFVPVVLLHRLTLIYFALCAGGVQSIFTALDKLYVLHNAFIVESRFIKSFFFYCCITFLIYMLTSTKSRRWPSGASFSSVSFRLRNCSCHGFFSHRHSAFWNTCLTSADISDMILARPLCHNYARSIKLGADDFSCQFWLLSKVLLLRSVFLAASMVQILHSIFTFKYVTPQNHA
jgi:hypothetical protein